VTGPVTVSIEARQRWWVRPLLSIVGRLISRFGIRTIVR